jgi:16S rRNA (cytosine1402-N4)-methyltransferase
VSINYKKHDNKKLIGDKYCVSHTPVMVSEVLDSLSANRSGVYLDMTFGHGGHTETILEANCDNVVYAIDRDPNVLPQAKAFEQRYPGRFFFFHSKFSDINDVLLRSGQKNFRGILFDLGASSMQLEDCERGFSFMDEGELDMRMGLNALEETAEQIVNYISCRELEEMISLYGEERYARKIAHAICDARLKDHIHTTKRLSDIIVAAISQYYVKARIHPATRTFQALRIVVNNELREIELGVSAAIECLDIGGRLVVLSFHALEDGLVKRIFSSRLIKERKNKYSREVCLPEVEAVGLDNIICSDGAGVKRKFQLVHKGVVTAGRDEVNVNRRARSAKLRALQRVDFDE